MEKSRLSVKLVIFSVIDGTLTVFLPDKLLPVSQVESDFALDIIAGNIFKKHFCRAMGRTYMEQLFTFSYPKEGGEIAVVYYILIPYYDIPATGQNMWVSGARLPKDISDKEIINYAVQRLRWKIEYTNAVYSLLPDEFTFSQLQSVYEAILGRTLDKRNFRKKILSLKILKNTGHIKKLGKTRPAEMFSFRKRKLTYVEII